LFVRVAAWVVLAVAATAWLARAAARGGLSAGRVLAGATIAILATAFLLERWPSSRTAPRFPDGLDLGGGAAVFLPGADVREDFARVAPGEVELLVRSRTPLSTLTVTAEGQGVVGISGAAPIALSPRGTRFGLPLTPLLTLAGRRGVSETLYRRRIVLDSPGEVVVRFMPSSATPRL
jgi:hypothetical protein